MNRRQFLAVPPAAAVLATGQPVAAHAERPAGKADVDIDAEEWDWHNVRDWGVEGRGFDDTENYFDRLPARAKSIVRKEVWDLSRQTAGMVAHFSADTQRVAIRYSLTSSRLAMPHMPATSVSGVDFYGEHESAWRWISTIQPEAQSISKGLRYDIKPGRRAYRLNFPLYNGVVSMEIGVPKGVKLTPIAPRKDKPVLFYGTSITQGACASRPGMCFFNILGRRLDRPMLNFGFSGNGKTEVEVGRLLAELDPAVFVVDTIANTTAEEITERLVPLVEVLVEDHPKTPVLILDERLRTDSTLVPVYAENHKKKTEALLKSVDALKSKGIDVHYRQGDDLLGSDGEAAVDGSHPTDLGMVRYADAIEGAIRALLPKR